MKIKSKILSMIMLILFGIPGIFAEGLHVMLPFGIGMIYHENFNDTPSQKQPLFPQPFQYNPNCPICQICSISIVNSFSIVLTILAVVIGAVDIRTSLPPIKLFYTFSYKRGPPHSSANNCAFCV